MKRAFAALLASVLGLAAVPAAAEGVGFNFAELGFGLGMSKSVVTDDTTNARLSGRGVVDFSLGSNVGTQLDFGIADYDLGTLASLEAHGYYTPNDRMKVGAFVGYGKLASGGVLAAVEDISRMSPRIPDLDADAHYYMGGVEGIFDLSDKATVEGSFGLGKAKAFGLEDDFKMATLGLDYDFNPTSTAFAKASLTDMDDIDLRMWAVDVGYKHHLASAPVTLSASVGVTGAAGDIADTLDVKTEPRVQLGAVWRFGKPASSARDTAFDSHEPFAPALQRLEF